MHRPPVIPIMCG